MVSEILENFGYAVFATLSAISLNTFIQWVLIFRRPKVREAIKNLQLKEAELLEAEKQESLNPSTAKKDSKRLNKLRIERQILKDEVQRSTLFINSALSLSMFIFNYIIGSFFEYRVCLKLPFSVAWPINKLTHKNLDGEDYTEGSFSCVYFLLNFCLKNMIERALDFKLPNTGMFGGAFNQMAMQ